MPVINLPQDNRWGSLGAGIGNIAGAALSAYNDKQLSSQVAEEVQSTTEQDKNKLPAKILAKFGRDGLATYDTMQQAQQHDLMQKLLLAQIGGQTIKNQIEAPKVTTAGQTANAELQGLLTGNAVKQAQVGNIQATTAATQQSTAEAAQLQPGKLAQQDASLNQTQSTTANTQAQTPGIKAASELEQVKVEQAKAQVARMKQMLADGDSPGTLDKVLTNMGIDPKSQVGQVAKNAYLMEPDLAKAGDKFMSVIEKRTGQDSAAAIRANTTQSLPTDERKIAGQATEFSESLGRFVDTLTKNPQETGLGEGIKAYLVKHGILGGDPQLLDLMENQAQIVASQATSGGGFFAQGRVKLAQDITPSVNRTVMANMIAADTIADRQIANLHTQIDSLAPNVIKKPLEDSLAKWQKIKETTGSLQAYQTTKEKTPVVFFQGNQVDPQTFKPVFKGADTFTVRGDLTTTGANVMQNARQVGMTPQAYLAAMRAHAGATP